MRIYSVTTIHKGGSYNQNKIEDKNKIWTSTLYFIDKKGQKEYFEYCSKSKVVNLIGIEKCEGKLRCPYMKGKVAKYSFR